MSDYFAEVLERSRQRYGRREADPSGINDGDTFTYSFDGTNKSVIRINGVDTPEWSQPGGPEAKARLKEMLASGRYSVRPIKNDPYGRVLANVFDENGRNVAETLISEGLARSGDDRYLGLEDSARTSGKGIWRGDPEGGTPPSAYRADREEAGYDPAENELADPLEGKIRPDGSEVMSAKYRRERTPLQAGVDTLSELVGFKAVSRIGTQAKMAGWNAISVFASMGEHLAEKLTGQEYDLKYDKEIRAKYAATMKGHAETSALPDWFDEMFFEGQYQAVETAALVGLTFATGGILGVPALAAKANGLSRAAQALFKARVILMGTAKAQAVYGGLQQAGRTIGESRLNGDESDAALIHGLGMGMIETAGEYALQAIPGSRTFLKRLMNIPVLEKAQDDVVQASLRGFAELVDAGRGYAIRRAAMDGLKDFSAEFAQEELTNVSQHVWGTLWGMEKWEDWATPENMIREAGQTILQLGTTQGHMALFGRVGRGIVGHDGLYGAGGKPAPNALNPYQMYVFAAANPETAALLARDPSRKNFEKVFGNRAPNDRRVKFDEETRRRYAEGLKFVLEEGNARKLEEIASLNGVAEGAFPKDKLDDLGAFRDSYRAAIGYDPRQGDPYAPQQPETSLRGVRERPAAGQTMPENQYLAQLVSLARRLTSGEEMSIEALQAAFRAITGDQSGTRKIKVKGKEVKVSDVTDPGDLRVHVAAALRDKIAQIKTPVPKEEVPLPAGGEPQISLDKKDPKYKKLEEWGEEFVPQDDGDVVNMKTGETLSRLNFKDGDLYEQVGPARLGPGVAGKGDGKDTAGYWVHYKDRQNPGVEYFKGPAGFIFRKKSRPAVPQAAPVAAVSVVEEDAVPQAAPVAAVSVVEEDAVPQAAPVAAAPVVEEDDDDDDEYLSLIARARAEADAAFEAAQNEFSAEDEPEPKSVGKGKKPKPNKKPKRNGPALAESVNELLDIAKDIYEYMKPRLRLLWQQLRKQGLSVDVALGRMVSSYMDAVYDKAKAAGVKVAADMQQIRPVIVHVVKRIPQDYLESDAKPAVEKEGRVKGRLPKAFIKTEASDELPLQKVDFSGDLRRRAFLGGIAAEGEYADTLSERAPVLFDVATQRFATWLKLLEERIQKKGNRPKKGRKGRMTAEEAAGFLGMDEADFWNEYGVLVDKDGMLPAQSDLDTEGLTREELGKGTNTAVDRQEVAAIRSNIARLERRVEQLRTELRNKNRKYIQRVLFWLTADDAEKQKFSGGYDDASEGLRASIDARRKDLVEYFDPAKLFVLEQAANANGTPENLEKEASFRNKYKSLMTQFWLDVYSNLSGKHGGAAEKEAYGRKLIQAIRAEQFLLAGDLERADAIMVGLLEYRKGRARFMRDKARLQYNEGMDESDADFFAKQHSRKNKQARAAAREGTTDSPDTQYTWLMDAKAALRIEQARLDRSLVLPVKLRYLAEIRATEWMRAENSNPLRAKRRERRRAEEKEHIGRKRAKVGTDKHKIGRMAIYEKIVQRIVRVAKADTASRFTLEQCSEMVRKRGMNLKSMQKAFGDDLGGRIHAAKVDERAGKEGAADTLARLVREAWEAKTSQVRLDGHAAMISAAQEVQGRILKILEAAAFLTRQAYGESPALLEDKNWQDINGLLEGVSGETDYVTRLVNLGTKDTPVWKYDPDSGGTPVLSPIVMTEYVDGERVEHQFSQLAADWYDAMKVLDRARAALRDRRIYAVAESIRENNPKAVIPVSILVDMVRQQAQPESKDLADRTLEAFLYSDTPRPEMSPHDALFASRSVPVGYDPATGERLTFEEERNDRMAADSKRFDARFKLDEENKYDEQKEQTEALEDTPPTSLDEDPDIDMWGRSHWLYSLPCNASNVLSVLSRMGNWHTDAGMTVTVEGKKPVVTRKVDAEGVALGHPHVVSPSESAIATHVVEREVLSTWRRIEDRSREDAADKAAAAQIEAEERVERGEMVELPLEGVGDYMRKTLAWFAGVDVELGALGDAGEVTVSGDIKDEGGNVAEDLMRDTLFSGTVAEGKDVQLVALADLEATLLAVLDKQWPNRPEPSVKDREVIRMELSRSRRSGIALTSQERDTYLLRILQAAHYIVSERLREHQPKLIEVDSEKEPGKKEKRFRYPSLRVVLTKANFNALYNLADLWARIPLPGRAYAISEGMRENWENETFESLYQEEYDTARAAIEAQRTPQNPVLIDRLKSCLSRLQTAAEWDAVAAWDNQHELRTYRGGAAFNFDYHDFWKLVEMLPKGSEYDTVRTHIALWESLIWPRIMSNGMRSYDHFHVSNMKVLDFREAIVKYEQEKAVEAAADISPEWARVEVRMVLNQADTVAGWNKRNVKGKRDVQHDSRRDRNAVTAAKNMILALEATDIEAFVLGDGPGLFASGEQKEVWLNKCRLYAQAFLDEIAEMKRDLTDNQHLLTSDAANQMLMDELSAYEPMLKVMVDDYSGQMALPEARRTRPRVKGRRGASILVGGTVHEEKDVRYRPASGEAIAKAAGTQGDVMTARAIKAAFDLFGMPIGAAMPQAETLQKYIAEFGIPSSRIVPILHDATGLSHAQVSDWLNLHREVDMASLTDPKALSAVAGRMRQERNKKFSIDRNDAGMFDPMLFVNLAKAILHLPVRMARLGAGSIAKVWRAAMSRHWQSLASLVRFCQYAVGVGGISRQTWNLIVGHKRRQEALFAEANAIAEGFNAALRMLYPAGAPENVVAALHARARGTANAMPKNVPAKLIALVDEMRDKIDEMTDEAIRNGLLDTLPLDKAFAILFGRGSYLNRSYSIFEVENWKPTPEMREKLTSELMKQGTGLKRETAEKLAELLANPKDFSAKPTELLGLPWPAVTGAHPLQDIQNVPEYVREYWGEITAPEALFMQTYTKLAMLNHTHRFKTAMRDLGVKEGWLSKNFDEKEFTKAMAPQEGALTELMEQLGTPKGAKAPNTLILKILGPSGADPLSGFFSKESVYRILEDLMTPPPDANWFTALGAGLKIGKVANTTTLLNNISAWFELGLSAGTFGIFNASVYRDAIAELGLESRAKNSANSRKRYRRLIELGMLNESVSEAVYRQHLSDLAGMTSAMKAPARVLGNILHKVFSYGDGFPRLVLFHVECARQRANNPGLGHEEIEERAAEIVNLTTPTASETPKGMVALQRMPVFGNFPVFVYQVFRSTFNKLRVGFDEMFERKNGRFRVRRASFMTGAARFASAMAVPLALRAVGQALSRLALPDEDEEFWESLNNLLPWWHRNGSYTVTKKKRGMVTLVNYGRAMGLQPIMDIVNAFMRGEDLKGSVLSMTAAAASPFLAPDIILTPFMNLMTDQAGEKSRYIIAGDDFSSNFTRIMELVYRAAAPTVLIQGERMYRSTVGDGIGPLGEKYSASNEVASLLGPRIESIDLHIVVAMRAKELNDLYKRYNSGMLKPFYEKNATEKRIVKGVRQGVADIGSLDVSLYKLVRDAKNVGMKPSEIEGLLLGAGFQKKDLDSYKKGKGLRPPRADAKPGLSDEFYSGYYNKGRRKRTYDDALEAAKKY